MLTVVVGADYEENLGVGMVAASARAAGHEVVVVTFDGPEHLEEAVLRVIEASPDVVGLAMQFQHRAGEFLDLARRLRALGWTGHLTAGGQVPSLGWAHLLGVGSPLDSAVLYDGEGGFAELLDALEAGDSVEQVAGLALPGPAGPRRTAPRPVTRDLDALPFPWRYRQHARHLGVPFVPVVASRGCWGQCAFCAITSSSREARERGGGPGLRERSCGDVADEVALLVQALDGEPVILCFHDDTFLRPRPADSLRRVLGLREALDARGVGQVAMVAKARPDCLTPALARELAALGVIRLYVGIENASEAGCAALARGMPVDRLGPALDACREAGIYTCTNLLIFEPGTVLDDVRDNIAFVRAHPDHPVNFCRAEPYHGTPLHRTVAAAGGLTGSPLGWNYRIADDRAEALFRVCAAVFRQRNFDADGVANRAMGLGYAGVVLEAFHGPHPDLAARVRGLCREITVETADLLEKAVDLVERTWGDQDAWVREAALLGLAVAARDRERHAALDRLDAALERAAAGAPPPERRIPRLARRARTAALGASLALWATGCDGIPQPQVVDPPPPDITDTEPPVVDPVPVDPGPPPPVIVDPAPPDPPPVVDPPPPDPEPTTIPEVDPGFVPIPPDKPVDFPVIIDPAPPPPVGDPAPYPILGDPVPPDRPIGDPPPPDPPPQPEGALRDGWRDTAPAGILRSPDLPLYDPPRVRLAHSRDGDAVRVRLEGGPSLVSTRWEALGEIEGEGREVRWIPAGEADALRVAVRSRGGIAVVSLRARKT